MENINPNEWSLTIEENLNGYSTVIISIQSIFIGCFKILCWLTLVGNGMRGL